MICTTGTNGYMCLHYVYQLPEKGYNIKAAICSVSDPSKTKYLSKIAANLGAADRLDFEPIGLLSISSMIKATMGRGANVILNMALSFTLKMSGGDPFKTIVEPAVASVANTAKVGYSSRYCYHD